MKKKTVALLLALTLVVGGVIGGTVAYLTTSTGEVKNTFTVGDINIDLWETKDGKHDANKIKNDAGNYVVRTRENIKVIPGSDIDKDPTVTVKAGAEACYLFLKVTATGWTSNNVTYTVDNTVWKPYEENGVVVAYYTEINSYTETDTDYNVLTGMKVEVKTGLTKEEAKTLTNMSLTFKAAAVQKDNVKTVAEAYGLVKTLLGN